MFHTYRKFSSVAVATLSLALRVARFKADRTFSLVFPSSARGTRRAEPSFNWSKSRRIMDTTFLFLPDRECGTSPRSSVLKFATIRPVFIVSLLHAERTTNPGYKYHIRIVEYSE